MANYSDLKDAIQQAIKANGNQEITGPVLQSTLLSIINSIGEGYTLKGIATPATNPANVDSNAIYLAAEKGTYTNFDNYILEGNKIVLFGNSSGIFKVVSEINLQETRSYNVKGYVLADDLAFKKVVRNIYVDTNGEPGNYKISYFMKNHVNYGKLGVQIADVTDGANVGTFYLPAGSDFMPGQLVELLNHAAEPLNKKGFKVYLEANDFIDFGTESFSDGVISGELFFGIGLNNPIINELMRLKHASERSTSLKTVFYNGTNSQIQSWFDVVQDVYLYNKNGQVNPEDYNISYFWFNENTGQVISAIARFGLQINLKGVEPSNYGIPLSVSIADLPKGQIVKLQTTDDQPLFDDLEVYVVLKNEPFPTTRLFTGAVIKVYPFQNTAILDHSKKLFDYFYNNAAERPTIVQRLNTANRILWHSLVKNIYIVDPQNEVGDIYRVNYLWLNDVGLGRLGLQISKNNAGSTNFRVTETPEPNKLYKLISQYDTEPLSYMNVFIEFADFENFPTDIFLESYDGVNIFLQGAFEYQKANNIISATQKSGDVTVNTINLTLEDNGNNAVQNALDNILDASKKNVYNLRIAPGIYKVTNSSQFLGYPGYPAMILAKDNVNIIGDSKADCIFWAELPYNDADIDTGIARGMHQTLYNWADNCLIENVTLVAKNIRYVLHQDNGNEANKTRRYKNVDFIYLGNNGNQVALGIGTFSGSKTYVEGGRSFSKTSNPFACHNNQKFANPSLWDFKGHTFSTVDQQSCIAMQNSGSLTSDILNLENCKFEGGFILSYLEWWIYTPNYNDHFNHADWKIKGFGNQPLYFYSNIKGKGLKVEASTVGQTVRFDKNSSAFDLIISNPHKYFGNLGHPERTTFDKYVIHDNRTGLKSYAIGAKSIQEDNYPFGTTTSSDKLGLRLGNCSTVNKTLRIVIGSTNYDVVFNKDYTTFTNAQIIAEINAVLGSAGVASEYIIGRDYYPEFTDVNYTLINAGATPILKGTLVKRQGGGVVAATTGDIVFGIAIDDMQPYTQEQGIGFGYGRIIRNAIFNVGEYLTQPGVVVEKDKKYSAVDGKLVENAAGNLIGFENDYLLIP